MNKARASLVSLLFFVSSSVLAGPVVFKVSANISQGGQALASPTIRVKPGAPAEVTVSGENGYRVAVSVTPVDGEAVDLSITVGTTLTSLQSTVTTLVGKPMVVSTGDIEVSVTVSDGDS